MSTAIVYDILSYKDNIYYAAHCKYNVNIHSMMVGCCVDLAACIH